MAAGAVRASVSKGAPIQGPGCTSAMARAAASVRTVPRRVSAACVRLLAAVAQEGLDAREGGTWAMSGTDAMTVGVGYGAATRVHVHALEPLSPAHVRASLSLFPFPFHALDRVLGHDTRRMESNHEVEAEGPKR